MNRKPSILGVKRILPIAALCITLIFLVIYAAASSPPAINLLSPQNSKVFNTTNSVTFQCNATDDGALRMLDLYTNINGTFSIANTSCFGELCADSSTALLMHFNNDSSAAENDAYVYDWSGSGNNAAVYGVPFNASGGKFFGAFEFDGTGNGYMKIPDSNSADLTSTSTIELWVYPRSLSGTKYLLMKAPSNNCEATSYGLLLDGNKMELDLGSYGVLTNIYTHDAASLLINQWYHLVATWNTTEVVLYVNNVSYYAVSVGGWDPPTNFPTNNNELWIASTDQSCGLGPYFFDGKIDELSLYTRMLSAEEVSEHYGRMLTNNASRNFTINNIPDGTYQWNCRAIDNESQENLTASNRTVYVDMQTPPSVNSIALSPNSTDDVDPDVRINVTANITDPSGVNTVLLQYGKVSLGFFTNATMTYNSTTKLYTTSFVPNTNGLWMYRIWANDSIGSAGTSNETNLSVEDDYTWTLSVINSTGNYSSELGYKYALKLTTAKMSVLIINNTGDDSLSFDLSAVPAIVTYNITEPFNLEAKTVKHVEVNATAPEIPSEYPIQITISSSGATPAQRAVNGTLVSYMGGPQFAVSIEDYAQTAQQSTTINLSAKVKNIGNETAVNVWLNWTLPAGWTNTTGNLSQYIGSLNSSATAWNNMEAYIDPVLSSSNFSTITASASSSNNASGSDSKLVGVSCSNSDNVCGNGCTYATDDDCTMPATSSNTGSGEGSRMLAGLGDTGRAGKYAMSIDVPSRIDAYRGQGANFAVSVSNSERILIENIVFSVEGYSQVLVSAEPKVIGTLSYSEKKQFNISMSIPNYTQYGEHELKFAVKGLWRSSSGNTTELAAEKPAVLFVHSATENETAAKVNDAIQLLESMKSSEFPAEKAEILIQEANKSLQVWDYDRAKELAEKAIELGKAAFRSHGSLKNLEELLAKAEAYRVNARQTSKMYSLAQAAFERGDYERAEERANNALLTASIEITGKITLLSALDKYSLEISLILIILALSAPAIYRKAAEKFIRRKLKYLDAEEKALQKLLEDSKIGYFKKSELSKSEYYKSLYDYERGSAEIKRAREHLALKLADLMKPAKAAEGFRKEEARVSGLIKEAQKKYFQDGAICRESYKSNVRELKGELAEIKMMVESAGNAAKRGRLGLLALAIISASIFAFAPATAIENVGIPAAGSESAAKEAILQAEADMSELLSMGFGAALANDTLNEAKLLFLQKNYLGATSLARHVETIKKTAVKIGGMIDGTETKIYDASIEGIDVSEAQELFNEGIKAFEAEDYVAAETLLDGAINKLEAKRAEAAMNEAMLKSRGGIAGFLKENWAGVLAFLAVSSAAGLFFWKKYSLKRAKKRIKELEGRLVLANKMIEELQRKYFERGAASKSEYTSGMKKYREIILKSKRELAVYKTHDMNVSKSTKSTT